MKAGILQVAILLFFVLSTFYYHSEIAEFNVAAYEKMMPELRSNNGLFLMLILTATFILAAETFVKA